MTSIGNTVLNLLNLVARSPIPSQLIASSLLLGLLIPLSTPISEASVPFESPSTAPTNSVQTRLQGRWQVEEPTSGQQITLVFTPDGKFLILLPVSPENSSSLSFRYRINPTPKPMHLDVFIPEDDQTAKTIFEFTADNQLRVQLLDTEPGQPRPTAFATNAFLFHKVSDATTLPEKTPANNPNEQVNRAQQAEAKAHMGTMSRAQQAYYLENEKFATKIEELGLGIRPENDNYRYQILPQGNQRQSVMITAQAKHSGLRSYMGVVFAVKSKDESLAVAQVCETDEPSMTPPAMPATPRDALAEIQCPAGSHSIMRR